MPCSATSRTATGQHSSGPDGVNECPVPVVRWQGYSWSVLASSENRGGLVESNGYMGTLLTAIERLPVTAGAGLA